MGMADRRHIRSVVSRARIVGCVRVGVGGMSSIIGFTGCGKLSSAGRLLSTASPAIDVEIACGTRRTAAISGIHLVGIANIVSLAGLIRIIPIRRYR
jgi:hypothetical protein